MLVIAVFAASLALPRLMNSPDRLVVSCLIGVLAALVLINKVIEVICGKPCPACSRRALRRLARHRHYYRCLECSRSAQARSGLAPGSMHPAPTTHADITSRPRPGSGRNTPCPRSSMVQAAASCSRARGPGELVGEIHPPPRSAGDRRRLEEAEKKVRKFLGYRHDEED